MCQLKKVEYENLQYKIVTTISAISRSLPYVFTEQEIYTLATVLRVEIVEQQT